MKKLIGMIMAIAMTFALATTAFAEDPSTTTATSGSKVFVTTKPAGKDETKFDKVNGNTIGIDIPANFVAGANDPYKVEANYYVIVKYEVEPKLVFTVGETAYTWNVHEGENGTVTSANHQLKSTYDGTWSGTAAVNVTVENWSNRDMQAAMTFAPNTTVATPDNDNGVLKPITVKNEAQTFSPADTNKDNTKWDTDNHALILQSAAVGVGFEEGKKADAPVSGDATFTINAANEGVTGAISKSNAVIGTLTVKLTALEGNTTFNSTNPSEP